MSNRIQILDHTGKPFSKNGNGHASRQDLIDMLASGRAVRRREVRASFDAARTTSEFENYWANADALDADSAHSPAVRGKLVTRSRYEAGSNGYYDGLLQTHANYVVGLGPSLNMKTPDPVFNKEVEDRWQAWCKATLFRRKLWCMCHAKVQDGESFGVLRNNPRVADPVKLDLVLFETEQCTTPLLPFAEKGRIDGIRFDDFGNPTTYDVLTQHPGGQFAWLANNEPEQIPASFMLHWFTLRRPGQHRAVPEFRSTLNVGAGARRWREATIAAAEEAANYAVILHTNLPPEQTADLAAPFSEVPSTKRAMVAAPMGWAPQQMDAKHPNATHEAFHRSQINEQARPKSIPQNVAMCDSSGYNFASGKLDHGTYFLVCDVEREDGNDLVLEKAFARWFERAALVYGWAVEPSELPAHGWDWPKHPVADLKSHAAANDTRLKNGTLTLSQAYADDGQDFEDKLPQMAKDYGVTPEEMRAILLRVNLGNGLQPAPEPEDEADADAE